MAVERPILVDVPEQFVGARILLRPLADADVAAVHTAIGESREHLQPWMPWYDKHQTPDDTREYVRSRRAQYLSRESFELGVFLRDGGTFLGGAGMGVTDWAIPAFDIGYWLRPSAEGHGYVSEATRLLTAFAFETLDAQRVTIHCDARNVRSKSVPERLGYVFEGRLRNEMRDPAGALRDTLVYAMTPADYAAANRAWP
jgi:RimJ/RimL family protein N-acetyltransferase